MAALVAKHFASLAVGPAGTKAIEPKWITPHTIALELKTVRLRQFGTGTKGTRALLCTPLALHGAAVADIAAGHSLIGTLKACGLRRLFAAD